MSKLNLDKFFNLTATRVLSIVAIIWSAIELGRFLKDKYDARKSNIVDVDAK